MGGHRELFEEHGFRTGDLLMIREDILFVRLTSNAIVDDGVLRNDDIVMFIQYCESALWFQVLTSRGYRSIHVVAARDMRRVT